MINKQLNHNNEDKTIAYEHATVLVKDEVDKALASSPAFVRTYTNHLRQSKGKFIRAISLLSCAQNNDGAVPQNAIKMAVAIEILHLATLVHDDIIDDADIRRGLLTLQKKFGNKTAVICGDYLMCKALSIGASISNKHDYINLNIPDYMSRICFGELKQHINNGNLDLSVYQYLKIIAGKTAALFEASFHAGAILSGAEKETIKKYRQLGHYIGMIFQLTDDCMDFVATKQESKKPVQSDYEQNVITLPLIHALKNLPSFKQKAKTNPITRQELNEAVFKTGGIDYTKKLAQKYYNKALKIINELNISENKRKNLKFVLDKSYRKIKYKS
jgi:heptaprenyl diphosphate synthase